MFPARHCDRVAQPLAEHRVGGGEFGEVWEVSEITHGWRRAVKLLHAAHADNANLRARFLLEGQQQNLLGTAIALAGVFAYSQVKRLGGKGKGDKAKAE